MSSNCWVDMYYDLIKWGDHMSHVTEKPFLSQLNEWKKKKKKNMWILNRITDEGDSAG